MRNDCVDWMNLVYRKTVAQQPRRRMHRKSAPVPRSVLSALFVPTQASTFFSLGRDSFVIRCNAGTARSLNPSRFEIRARDIPRHANLTKFPKQRHFLLLFFLPHRRMAEIDGPEVDDSHSLSGDSGYSGYSESMCSTESVSSSVFEYEVKHGRTYHAYHPDKYYMPNDEGEQERLDLHYHALRLAIEDKITWAPIDQPHATLDVGTGTGIWAMGAADAWPEAEVVGLDLSPIQPKWVPPNLTFEVADADEPWGFAPNRFSLVHTRIMNGFGVSSWPHFYREAFSCLKPGG